MQSMKIEKEEYDQPVMAEGSDYPCGLCLYLDEASIDALGLKTLPELGSTMSLQAQVTVTSVSQDQGIYGLQRSLRLQITAMDLSSKGE